MIHSPPGCHIVKAPCAGSARRLSSGRHPRFRSSSTCGLSTPAPKPSGLGTSEVPGQRGQPTLGSQRHFSVGTWRASAASSLGGGIKPDALSCHCFWKRRHSTQSGPVLGRFKTERCALLVGLSNGATEVLLKMLNICFVYQITIWSSNPTSGLTPKRTESRGSNRYLHTHVHWSIIHNRQIVETTQVPIMDEWINKMWSICTKEYYSALKRKEILTRATTWMNLESTVLSEISQTQKDRCCMIPLTWGP